MTAKEKAKELVNKYLQVYDGRLPIAKQCALIAVDEMLNIFIQIFNNLVKENIISGEIKKSATYKYFQEVKKEIENL
jgi:hypothetical protein